MDAIVPNVLSLAASLVESLLPHVPPLYREAAARALPMLRLHWKGLVSRKCRQRPRPIRVSSSTADVSDPGNLRKHPDRQCSSASDVVFDPPPGHPRLIWCL